MEITVIYMKEYIGYMLLRFIYLVVIVGHTAVCFRPPENELTTNHKGFKARRLL